MEPLQLGSAFQLLFGDRPYVIQMKEVESASPSTQEPSPSVVRSREKALVQSVKKQVGQELQILLQSGDFPPSKIWMSASHTRNEKGHWVIVLGSDHPVGIDVEAEHREVHPRLEQKILSEEERSLELMPLEAWVIKEAAFKAQRQNEGTVLSQYRILSWDRSQDKMTGLGKIRTPSGKMTRFQLLNREGWLIAVAHS